MPCRSHAEDPRQNVFGEQNPRTGKGLPTWILKLETASCTATYHFTRPDGMDLSEEAPDPARNPCPQRMHCVGSRLPDVYHGPARLPRHECGCGGGLLRLFPEKQVRRRRKKFVCTCKQAAHLNLSASGYVGVAVLLTVLQGDSSGTADGSSAGPGPPHRMNVFTFRSFRRMLETPGAGDEHAGRVRC